MGEEQPITLEGLGRLYSLSTVGIEMPEPGFSMQDAMMIIQPLAEFGVLHLNPENGEILSPDEVASTIMRNQQALVHTPQVSFGNLMLVSFFTEEINFQGSILSLIKGKVPYSKKANFRFTLYSFGQRAWEIARGPLQMPDIVYFGNLDTIYFHKP